MNKKAAKGKDAEVCSRSIIHVDIVRKAEKSLPSHEILFDVADFFKIFGDSCAWNNRRFRTSSGYSSSRGL
jgi:hypothetical protein